MGDGEEYWRKFEKLASGYNKDMVRTLTENLDNLLVFVSKNISAKFFTEENKSRVVFSRE